MSIIITALAVAGAQAAPATTPAVPPANHAQHQQMAPKQGAEGCCCCKSMAEGKKMACCEQHEQKAGAQAAHSGHSAH